MASSEADALCTCSLQSVLLVQRLRVSEHTTKRQPALLHQEQQLGSTCRHPPCITALIRRGGQLLPSLEHAVPCLQSVCVRAVMIGKDAASLLNACLHWQLVKQVGQLTMLGCAQFSATSSSRLLDPAIGACKCFLDRSDLRHTSPRMHCFCKA